LAEKQKYQVGNRQVLGQEIEFEPVAEPWSQFKLADGSQIKAKLILVNVARLDEYTDQGDPVYQFQIQQIVTVIAPEELKRKKQ
jgi:hypothetical protein